MGHCWRVASQLAGSAPAHAFCYGVSVTSQPTLVADPTVVLSLLVMVLVATA